ncbi:MAG: glycosyltransferase [Acidobacteria bacterium]|nr:glycosyltransferase [Acidobacteriota bacterium]
MTILTTRFGSLGPYIRARNYHRLLSAHFPTELYDVSTQPNAPVRATAHIWRATLVHTPQIWRFLYNHWQRIPTFDAIRRNLSPPFFRQAMREVAALQPSLILSTNVHTTTIASWWKLRGTLQAPIVVALNAWHFQPSWCLPAVDHYLACTTHQRDQLIAHGVPANRITVAGFLIAPEFHATSPRQTSRTPNVLLMGGGEGWFLHQSIEALAAVQSPARFTILCGNHRSAQSIAAQIERIPQLRNRSSILGYTHNPAPYFAAADLLITKPGAMTLAEAFASSTPVLALHAIAGHEEAGLAILRAENAVATPRPNESLAHTVDRLLKSPAELHRLAARGRELVSTSAATIIPQVIRQSIPA